jgi:hypothetical protein
LVPTAEEDFDISLFGYIDERPPEKVSGVGITLDQKKVHPPLSLSLSRRNTPSAAAAAAAAALISSIAWSIQVPFFVSWFEMAASGLDMLETFLKVRPTRARARLSWILPMGATDDGSGVPPPQTQRPAWRALPGVLEELHEQKKRLNAWKDNFGKEVIGKALHEQQQQQQADSSSAAASTRYAASWPARVRSAPGFSGLGRSSGGWVGFGSLTCCSRGSLGSA